MMKVGSCSRTILDSGFVQCTLSGVGQTIRLSPSSIKGLSGCNDIGVDRANFDLIFSTFSVLDDEAVMRKQLHEAREQLVRQRLLPPKTGPRWLTIMALSVHKVTVKSSSMGWKTLSSTVVDNNICHPTEFDFFLCGHAGAKVVTNLYEALDNCDGILSR
ncbi:Protein argonaute 1 [Zea mays]|uniref:Protein argonaute 1 n=1 Tax=Zea mays TaxID=4577 RepID=A0A1D6IHT6_MAIZE|nr:Protein argonaute 1 [Zea mays]